MVHTLVEYAKTVQDVKQRAIIELFPEDLDFMRAMPFKTAPGGRYGYFREGALPTNMGFRAINETPAEGHGVINDLTEQCFPIAGNIDVDRVLINRYGVERRSMEERMSMKRKAKVLGDTFIGGDNASNPREYTGLKNRLRAVGTGTPSVDGSNYDSRIIANSTASGGGALSLAMLDIAIGLVDGANAIIMPKRLVDRFPAAVRDAGVGGVYTNDTEDMGRRVDRYRGIPLYSGYGVSPLGSFLSFNEVAYGGGSAITSSIYIVQFGEMGVCGLETSAIQVQDMGLLNDAITYRTNIEHDVGLCIENPYTAIRLSSVADAAIVK